MYALMLWRKAAPPFKPWPAPNWTTSTAEECLEQVRQYVEQQLDGEIGWYKRTVEGTRLFSRGLRALAIVFTTLGGLVPVLKAAGLLQLITPAVKDAAFDASQLGYVFLGVAGGFAFFDRFFGFSTAWMRYVAAMCALERLRQSFRLEWVALARPRPGLPSEDAHGRLLEVAKRSLLKAKELTEQETDAWITEFKSNLAQSEKDLRAQLEAARPGAIDIKVKDGSKAVAGFDLRLDQLLVEHVTGASASVGNVAPGLHKVSATASVAGKTYLASQMVNVVATEIAPVELELGIP
jgi:hypothetical protein